MQGFSTSDPVENERTCADSALHLRRVGWRGWRCTAHAGGYVAGMARHNSDLQAAVDATSVAKDARITEDLAAYLREQLAERDIETSDDAWVQQVLEGIDGDRNYMIENEPSDFEAG